MTFKMQDDTPASYLSIYLADRKRREEKRREQLNIRISPELKHSLRIVCRVQGIEIQQAVEQALFDWIRTNSPPQSP